MKTLGEIEPGIGFHDLEILICDAVDMVDVLAAALHEHFSKGAPEEGFALTANEGHRLFFLASMALAMSEKTKDAYYRAWENERQRREAA